MAGCQIHRSTDGTLGDVIGTGPSGFIDTTAVSGVTYTYFVKAVDEAANVSWRSNLVAARALITRCPTDRT